MIGFMLFSIVLFIGYKLYKKQVHRKFLDKVNMIEEMIVNTPSKNELREIRNNYIKELDYYKYHNSQTSKKVSELTLNVRAKIYGK